MALGFVLVSTEAGAENDVYEQLAQLPELKEVHPLRGEYDLIAKVEADDFDSLGRVVVDRIRSVDGVVDTRTLTGTRF